MGHEGCSCSDGRQYKPAAWIKVNLPEAWRPRSAHSSEGARRDRLRPQPLCADAREPQRHGTLVRRRITDKICFLAGAHLWHLLGGQLSVLPSGVGTTLSTTPAGHVDDACQSNWPDSLCGHAEGGGGGHDGGA